MVDVPTDFHPAAEAFLARLTSAAYEVALQHGVRGSFLDVELDLWRELREVVRQELAAADASAAVEWDTVARNPEACAWRR